MEWSNKTQSSVGCHARDQVLLHYVVYILFGIPRTLFCLSPCSPVVKAHCSMSEFRLWSRAEGFNCLVMLPSTQIKIFTLLMRYCVHDLFHFAFNSSEVCLWTLKGILKFSSLDVGRRLGVARLQSCPDNISRKSVRRGGPMCYFLLLNFECVPL